MPKMNKRNGSRKNDRGGTQEVREGRKEIAVIAKEWFPGVWAGGMQNVPRPSTRMNKALASLGYPKGKPGLMSYVTEKRKLLPSLW